MYAPGWRGPVPREVKSPYGAMKMWPEKIDEALEGDVVMFRIGGLRSGRERNWVSAREREERRESGAWHFDIIY